MLILQKFLFQNWGKALLAGIFFTILLSLTGCHGLSPQDSVATQFLSVKNQDLTLYGGESLKGSVGTDQVGDPPNTPPLTETDQIAVPVFKAANNGTIFSWDTDIMVKLTAAAGTEIYYGLSRDVNDVVKDFKPYKTGVRVLELIRDPQNRAELSFKIAAYAKKNDKKSLTVSKTYTFYYIGKPITAPTITAPNDGTVFTSLEDVMFTITAYPDAKIYYSLSRDFTSVPVNFTPYTTDIKVKNLKISAKNKVTFIVKITSYAVLMGSKSVNSTIIREFVYKPKKSADNPGQNEASDEAPQETFSLVN